MSKLSVDWEHVQRLLNIDEKLRALNMFPELHAAALQELRQIHGDVAGQTGQLSGISTPAQGPYSDNANTLQPAASEPGPSPQPEPEPKPNSDTSLRRPV